MNDIIFCQNFKFNEFCYNQVKETDKFYKLLTIKNERDLNSITKDEKLLINYSNKLKDLSGNDKYKEKVMDQRIEDNLAKQEGYFEGVDDGVKQKQCEIVLNMYNNKISIEMISKCTNLSQDEVLKIINLEK